MEIDIYCNMYLEWIKNMYHIGTAAKLAFKDLREKSNHILDNRQLFVDLGLIDRNCD